MKIKSFLENFISLLYPEICVICGEPLIENEKFFCFACFLKLPKTNYHLNSENQAIDRFSGKVSIVKASSYLYYSKGGIAQKLVAEIKYRGNQHLGLWIGSYLANEMLSSGFFQGINCIIPVPLHVSKEKKRGFNQSEKIAEGISQITKIPIEKSIVYREKANISQTGKGIFDRWKNTQLIFNLKNKNLLKEKHILLIDDVLTTGSTLEAVAQSLIKIQDIKISILTLAIT